MLKYNNVKIYDLLICIINFEFVYYNHINSNDKTIYSVK